MFKKAISEFGYNVNEVNILNSVYYLTYNHAKYGNLNKKDG